MACAEHQHHYQVERVKGITKRTYEFVKGTALEVLNEQHFEVTIFCTKCGAGMQMNKVSVDIKGGNNG